MSPHLLYRRLCEDLVREISRWPYRPYPDPPAIARAKAQLAKDREFDANDHIECVSEMPECWRRALRRNGVTRISQAKRLGVTGLMEIKGIGTKKAQWIIAYLKDIK